MKFYNRKKELEELQRLNNARPSFLVITGKRRVGKTELMIEYLKKHKGIYFFVDHQKNEALLLQEFVEELKRMNLIPEYIKMVQSMEDFLSLLFSIQEEIIVIFDEFQRFLKINPAIINQFQKAWDLRGSKSKTFLMVSGSSMGMIKKVFTEQQTPLFKRADNIISLTPFSFAEINVVLQDLGIKSFEERLKFYFLFGGVIYYYKHLEKFRVQTFQKAIEELVFREFAPLRNEVQEMMIEGFGKEHRTYYEILSAIAMGKNTKKEMADFVGVEHTSLSPYLHDLSSILNVIDYRLPITEDPLKSKKGRYCLSDPFISFWFRFLFRNKSEYEQKRYDEIITKIKPEINSFFGLRFEEFSRDMVRSMAQEDLVPFASIGQWWGHYRDASGRQELEIDICSVKEEHILVGEVKWQGDVNVHELLKALKNKTEYIKHGTAFYLIIAKSFREKIRSSNVCCLDLEDIESYYSSSMKKKLFG